MSGCSIVSEYRRWLVLMLCLGAADAALANEYTLKVKPRLCIVSEEQPACDAPLEAVWAAPASGNYCLYQQGQTQPLQCWNGASAGRYAANTTIRAPLLLQLTNTSDGSTVARAEVEVLSEDNSDRRRKRRRRHVWSIL